MWMKLLVEDCWSSFLSVYCVSYVNVCTYDIALVQLSYVISFCKHYVIGHVIGHVSCENHVYRERERERETERESSRVSVRDRSSISAFVAGVVCLNNTYSTR